ncbi:MAG TPA: NADH-quinone oxidoreductase subunit C [Armatimonadota bacterium]
MPEDREAPEITKEQAVAQTVADPGSVTPEALMVKLPDHVLKAETFRGDVVGVVRPESIREVCLALRDDADWQMNFLADLTCVDTFPTEPRFHLIYQLRSIPAARFLTLRTSVPASEPEIDSVEPVWGTANWLERELFDLFGIVFRGHTNLKRIFMPEGWDGSPLRRDYSVGKSRVPF